MRKEHIINTCCFIAGGMFSFIPLFSGRYVNNKSDEEYIYKGEIYQKNISFKTEGSLFQPDSTIIKYANEFNGGIISSPQLANDIATAILEEHYSMDCITNNKPFSISKDITTWNINGLCYPYHESFVFGVQLHISLNRLNGMVTSMYGYNL